MALDNYITCRTELEKGFEVGSTYQCVEAIEDPRQPEKKTLWIGTIFSSPIFGAGELFPFHLFI